MIFDVAFRRALVALATMLAILGCSNAYSAHCSVASTSVGFGQYDTLSSVPTDATATVQVACDQPVPYVIKLGPGANSAGNFMQRQMRSPQGRAPLFYNLFLDAGFSTIWGDGSGATTPFFGGGQASRENITVYGRIPALQGVGAGIYTDTVVITVEW